MLALVHVAGAVEMRHLIQNPPESRRATGVGLTMGVSVGLFSYGGLWLDETFGTRPWLLLICVVAGLLGSFLHMIQVLMPEKWPWPTKPDSDAVAEDTEASKEPAEHDRTET